MLNLLQYGPFRGANKYERRDELSCHVLGCVIINSYSYVALSGLESEVISQVYIFMVKYALVF